VLKKWNYTLALTNQNNQGTTAFWKLRLCLVYWIIWIGIWTALIWTGQCPRECCTQKKCFDIKRSIENVAMCKKIMAFMLFWKYIARNIRFIF
jgi:hypothetical protein